MKGLMVWTIRDYGYRKDAGNWREREREIGNIQESIDNVGRGNI